LVAAAQDGDRDALDALLRRNYDRIHAVCRRLTGNDADAADAAQEALIAIVRGLPRFDARSRFTTWAYRVTVNACLDELRRRRRRPEPAADPPDTGGVDGTGAIAARLDIDAAIVRLAPEFRAPVVLRDLCGLDYAEIAEVLAIPPGTVRSRIARGRGQLAALLAPTGNPDQPANRQTPQP
jgi:RNA polymerase sigma-70 factor (ECF subfamily)